MVRDHFRRIIVADTLATIALRKTTRSFTDTLPDTASMEAIAKTAWQAPFGGATGIPLSEGRKVFVLLPESAKRTEAVTILYTAIRKNTLRLRWLLKCVPWLKKKMGAFSAQLDMLAVHGIPGLDQATYYVIVAERRGFPPVEKQSLAHVMENMWLAATDMGLGFQMLSATSLMGKSPAFMNLLGLEKGKWALDGCLIGYADEAETAKRNPAPTEPYVVLK